MSWRWCWQCWCGSLPSFFLPTVTSPLSFLPLFSFFLLSFSPLFFFLLPPGYSLFFFSRSLLLCSPRVLSAHALPYSSSLSSLNLLTISFFLLLLFLSFSPSVSCLFRFLCPFSFPLLWCGCSSSFYSQRMPAFLVSRRPSRWRGMSTAIPAPLIRE